MSSSKREMTSSASATNSITATGAGTAGGNAGGEGFQIPLIHDNLTFESRQAMRLKELEKRLDDELKKKSRDWDREVSRMRDEFLSLYPADRKWGSEEMLDDGGLVARRRGSTDVLDPKKMTTLFLEYPDSGRRYKLRFNVDGFDAKNVRVTTDGERIIVRCTRREKNEKGEDYDREYLRKIEKPKEVDHTKLNSYLTTDGILIVEAPLPPASLNLRKVTSSSSPSRSASTSNNHHGGSSTSLRSKSPSRSPCPAAAAAAVAAGASGSSTPAAAGALGGREKVGVPTYRDGPEPGRRQMTLLLDVGTTFNAKEITVQIIKENRVQVYVTCIRIELIT